MGLSPETVVAPTAQAPADRPTLAIEKWARDGLALLFGDNKLDMTEREILRDLFEEIALRAQNGGIGNGATPAAEMPPEQAGDPNAVEDYGTEPGATPMDTETSPWS